MLKSVLITGAGSGLGEVTTIHLAQKGFKVFASDLRLDTVTKLKGLGGGRITPIELDVTSDESVDAAMAKISESGASLFGLVNNAGLMSLGASETAPLSDWQRQFDVNVLGVARMTRAVTPQMRTQGFGRIVNIASMAGRLAPAFMGAYSASKHAVMGMTASLRQELKPHGVQVSAIMPNFVPTPMMAHELDRLAEQTEAAPAYAEQHKQFGQWLKRAVATGVSPLEVAEAIEHALTAERPKPNYVVPKSSNGALILQDMLPTGISERIMRLVTR